MARARHARRTYTNEKSISPRIGIYSNLLRVLYSATNRIFPFRDELSLASDVGHVFVTGELRWQCKTYGKRKTSIQSYFVANNAPLSQDRNLFKATTKKRHQQNCLKKERKSRTQTGKFQKAGLANRLNDRPCFFDGNRIDLRNRV